MKSHWHVKRGAEIDPARYTLAEAANIARGDAEASLVEGRKDCTHCFSPLTVNRSTRKGERP